MHKIELQLSNGYETVQFTEKIYKSCSDNDLEPSYETIKHNGRNVKELAFSTQEQAKTFARKICKHLPKNMYAYIRVYSSSKHIIKTKDGDVEKKVKHSV